MRKDCAYEISGPVKQKSKKSKAKSLPKQPEGKVMRLKNGISGAEDGLFSRPISPAKPAGRMRKGPALCSDDLALLAFAAAPAMAEWGLKSSRSARRATRVARPEVQAGAHPYALTTTFVLKEPEPGVRVTPGAIPRMSRCSCRLALSVTRPRPHGALIRNSSRLLQQAAGTSRRARTKRRSEWRAPFLTVADLIQSFRVTRCLILGARGGCRGRVWFHGGGHYSSVARASVRTGGIMG